MSGAALNQRSAFVFAALLCAMAMLSHYHRPDSDESTELRTRKMQNGILFGEFFQPRVVTVEKHPATKAFGSLSLPRGSPWCEGEPTYWLVGHQKWNETPSCLGPDGEWRQKMIAVLDTEDLLNVDNNAVDRHDCVTMDVNYDGIPDIICGVGADKGEGEGFNELYLTQKDGSLEKILTGHGLHEFPTMRNRLAVTLHDSDGSDLIFMATRGTYREDDEPNSHRMFKNIYEDPDILPWFEQVLGPWRIHTEVSCLVVTDLDGNGIDDMIMCSEDVRARLFRQRPNGEWEDVDLGSPRYEEYVLGWRNARTADMDGDGLLDLLVVGPEPANATFRIFPGTRRAPYFNFDRPLFEDILPHAAPDLEVMDVDGDGWLDVYVVQSDETGEGAYCNAGNAQDVNLFWGGDTQPSPGK